MCVCVCVRMYCLVCVCAQEPGILTYRRPRGRLRGVIVRALDYGIKVSEFELHSNYHVHFQTSILRNGMNTLILIAIG